MQSGSIHCHLKNISRKREDGGRRSVVAKAAYNSGTSLWIEHEQRMTSLHPRQDVVNCEILAPPNAPSWVRDRAELWNRVECDLRRRDARLAKEFQVAITYGIPTDDWPKMLRDFCEPFLALGCVADVCIHEDDSGQNPHAHILLSVNELTPTGVGAKLTKVERKDFLTTARTRWEVITNEMLKAYGLETRVNARSFKARGIARTPSKHRGPDRAERQRKRERMQQEPSSNEVSSTASPKWYVRAQERAQAAGRAGEMTQIDQRPNSTASETVPDRAHFERER